MKKIFLLIILMGSFLRPDIVLCIENSHITGKISYGYDDNIYEQAESKTGRSFISLYLDSKLYLFSSSHIKGGLRLQDGIKVIGKDENVFLNQLNLRFALFLSPKINSEVFGRVKHKNVSLRRDSSQSENEYLYWYSGLLFKFQGNKWDTDIRYLFRRQDYTSADFFDAKAQQIHSTTNFFISRRFIGILTGKKERARFSGPQEKDSKKRIDNLYEVGLGFQYLQKILVNPGYTLLINKSNSTEYSFTAHQISILAAFPLSRGITMQVYGRLQQRQYDNQTFTYDPADKDDPEQSHNLFIFSLSKDISKKSSIEARYLLSQTEFPPPSIKYKKKSFSLTLNYSF